MSITDLAVIEEECEKLLIAFISPFPSLYLRTLNRRKILELVCLL
jgi:hypothetical protein